MNIMSEVAFEVLTDYVLETGKHTKSKKKKKKIVKLLDTSGKNAVIAEKEDKK